MRSKPDFGRIAATLQHQEPDRVPLVEAAVDFEIMSQYLGQPVRKDTLRTQVEFWYQAGYDYIPLTVGMMPPGRVTGDSHISRVIRGLRQQDTACQRADEAWNLERSAVIQTERDFQFFPWHQVANRDHKEFLEVQSFLPEGMKIIALSGKIFTMAWMLMGFDNFMLNLKLKPHFVKQVLRKVAEIQLDGLKAVASIPNVEVAWAVDDLAFGTGPMMSPQAFREFIFPWYDEFAAVCRAKDLFFFFHSDGVLWDLIEDLIALGVHALHPVDPTCMDIEEVKSEIGDRICLIGNIPNDLLMNGTPAEIRALTKKRLKVLAPGGGYCLGSGNSVPRWARVENYRAMIDTGLECGRYPISIR